MKVVGGHLNAAIVGTLAGSAVLNAMAFGATASGRLLPLAVTFGLAIPALVYCCTFVGARMSLER